LRRRELLSVPVRLAVTAISMHALDGSLSVRKTSESTKLALDEFNDRIRPDDRDASSFK
jgi:hypothetical protein